MNVQFIPRKLGAVVVGVNLQQQVTADVVSLIKEEITRFRILVFKDQGILSGDRQLEVTNWFGEVETAGFELHEKSPSRSILRVSNDESEGFRSFGTAGFHVDGSFMKCPNAYSIYHIVSCPKIGSTVFVPLHEVIEGLTLDQYKRWNRLWIMKTFQRIRGYRDKPGYVVHPLIYTHPGSGKKTLCIHQGKTNRFIWDKGSPRQRLATKEETVDLLKEIDSELYRNNEELLYYHEWEPGDLIISDNLAVGHLASVDTQRDRLEVGLRVMHRTIVKGTFRPRKDFDVESSIGKQKGNIFHRKYGRRKMTDVKCCVS